MYIYIGDPRRPGRWVSADLSRIITKYSLINNIIYYNIIL